jgi:hypothetical protein
MAEETESGLLVGDFSTPVGNSRSARERRAMMNSLIAMSEQIDNLKRLAIKQGNAIEQQAAMLGKRDVLFAVICANLPGGKATVLATQITYFMERMRSGEYELKVEVDELTGEHRLSFLRHDTGPRAVESLDAEGVPTEELPASVDDIAHRMVEASRVNVAPFPVVP